MKKNPFAKKGDDTAKDDDKGGEADDMEKSVSVATLEKGIEAVLAAASRSKPAAREALLQKCIDAPESLSDAERLEAMHLVSGGSSSFMAKAMYALDPTEAQSLAKSLDGASPYLSELHTGLTNHLEVVTGEIEKSLTQQEDVSTVILQSTHDLLKSHIAVANQQAELVKSVEALSAKLDAWGRLPEGQPRSVGTGAPPEGVQPLAKSFVDGSQSDQGNVQFTPADLKMELGIMLKSLADKGEPLTSGTGHDLVHALSLTDIQGAQLPQDLVEEAYAFRKARMKR